jgi:hypothetical protein
MKSGHSAKIPLLPQQLQVQGLMAVCHHAAQVQSLEC